MVDAKDQSLVICTVFVEIIDYAKKPVAEQIKLTERFNALLSEALKNIAPDDRIILDTGSGAAVSCLGKTEDALLVAIDLRDRIAAEASQPGSTLTAHLGINVGPVKLVKESGGEPNIIGDGITVAQNVMSFAVPGQILVSRAYHDAVSGVSQDYAKLLKSEGSRTDKYLREHQVYSVGNAVGGAGAALSRTQKMRLGALGAIVAILVIAVGARMMRTKPAPPPETPPVTASDTAPASAIPAPATPPVTTPAESAPPTPESKAPKKKVVKPKTDIASAPGPAPVAAPAAAVPAAPGSLDFAITPWGEVYVDGAKRGVSPPLTQIQIAPGRHTVEVRNTSFPSYTTTVEVTSGVQSKIKYKFN